MDTVMVQFLDSDGAWRAVVEARYVAFGVIEVARVRNVRTNQVSVIAVANIVE